MASKKDITELAKFIADIATGEIEVSKSDKKPGSGRLSSLRGLKGGKKRANTLTAEQRFEIAKKAATKTWEAKNRS